MVERCGDLIVAAVVSPSSFLLLLVDWSDHAPVLSNRNEQGNKN